MPSALIRALATRHGLPTVDANSIDAFLAPAPDRPEVTILFFTGDPAQRSESDDVAVVLPQILRAFEGQLRAAVVSRTAEDALKSRFHVFVMPSLAITRGAIPLAVIPKIKDWSDYVRIVLAALAPGAPALTSSGAGPKTEFNYSGRGASA
jgi:hydrogenase-1 operon protein HyaE